MQPLPRPLRDERIGAYLRVSTLDQESGIASQEKAIADYLEGHGLEAKYFRDKLSGKDLKRPGFERLQRDIFDGRIKTVITWKLDRLSRSLRDGINVLTDWIAKDVRVIAVSQQLDFSGPTGQLIASILFALAQMERESIRENTKRGLAAARARGVRLGKRPSIFAKDILPLLQEGKSVSEAARILGCSRMSCYNALKRDNMTIPR